MKNKLLRTKKTKSKQLLELHACMQSTWWLIISKGTIDFFHFSLQLRYCSPQIMNDLTKFAIDNHEDIDFQDFTNFIRVMSFVGFQPDSFEDFQNVCIKMLDEHIMETSLPKQLRFTLDLCQLQIYPDHWLSSMFTLKYIEMIDNHIESKSTHFVYPTPFLGKCKDFGCFYIFKWR